MCISFSRLFVLCFPFAQKFFFSGYEYFCSGEIASVKPSAGLCLFSGPHIFEKDVSAQLFLAAPCSCFCTKLIFYDQGPRLSICSGEMDHIKDDIQLMSVFVVFVCLYVNGHFHL